MPSLKGDDVPSTLHRILIAVAIAGFVPGVAAASPEAEETAAVSSGAEALPQLERALDVARANYGEDSRALVPTLTDLAQAYRLIGRTDHAEPLYQQAIRLDDQGGDEARLATNLASLALVYRAAGRLSDAEPLYERALPLLERTLGADHPEVARCLTNRAVLYWHEGKPEKALPLQRRALKIAQKAFGADHPKTAALRRNLELMKTAPSTAVAAASEPAPPVPAPRRQRTTSSARLAKPVVTGRFAIEVGSVTRPEEAATAWKRLAGRHASLASLELRPPWPVQLPDRQVTHRIVAGAFATEAQARAACVDIRDDGGSCRVLTP
jgi:tetratricopeptide (TPR) repeat protein